MALYFWEVNWWSSMEELELNCSLQQTKCSLKPKDFYLVRMTLATVVWRQGFVGNLSLLCVVENASATPNRAVWLWSQILFCSICTNCISHKDLNFSLQSIFYCCIFLSVSVCGWHRRGDLVKRDFDWNLLQLFGSLTGDVYFWLLNKISSYKMKIGH